LPDFPGKPGSLFIVTPIYDLERRELRLRKGHPSTAEEAGQRPFGCRSEGEKYVRA